MESLSVTIMEQTLVHNLTIFHKTFDGEKYCFICLFIQIIYGTIATTEVMLMKWDIALKNDESGKELERAVIFSFKVLP